ncbi:MAG: hypothetical protein MZU84_01020 [Sphingobacterium sp.]|nr:hypothetical protein [Sphingobacterium sp.]
MFFVGIYGFLVRKKPDHHADVGRIDPEFGQHQFCGIQQVFYIPISLQGMFFTVFIIAVAAAEACRSNRNHHQYLQAIYQHRRGKMSSK